MLIGGFELKSEIIDTIDNSTTHTLQHTGTTEHIVLVQTNIYQSIVLTFSFVYKLEKMQRLLSSLIVLLWATRSLQTSAFAPSSRTISIPHRAIQIQTRNECLKPNLSVASPLFSKETDSATSSDEGNDPLIKEIAIRSRRVYVVSWWSQVILTVVSSVTLLFAKSVLKVSSDKSLVSGGFLFAGSGITFSAISIIWTWGSGRLSRRLRKADYSRIKAANIIRRAITIGSALNLFGMFVTLIGAQQIVGLLASKLLTMQGVTPFGMSAAAVSAQTLQPLDILIVQANTNTLLSHFISLVCCLIMTRSVDKLDPPSTEDDPR